MKAAITLTPAESKRLLAKAVARMPEVKAALERAYVILGAGTTNAYVAQELGLLEPDAELSRFTAGVSAMGVLCVTVPGERLPFPIILHKGKVVARTIREALDDFNRETVVIKGANAVDAEGNVGVITSGFDGGTVAYTIGTVTSQGLNYIVPVGLEKMVRSVKEATQYTGAKTLDYSMGADFGMYCLTKALVVTEVEALRALFGVEAKHVASGGIAGSEGAVVLVITGDEPKVKAAIALLESIKGERPPKAIRGDCASCRYACRYAGVAEAQLPAWLQRQY